MKRGDIVLNRWASNLYPDSKYFIFLGFNGKYGNGIRTCDNKIEKVQYYKNDLKSMLYHDGKLAYPVVGHCDIDKIISDILSKYKMHDY